MDRFLDIARSLDVAEGPGNRHGGVLGESGRGRPRGRGGEFLFATGIECSYPRVDHGRVRRDQMEECGHYARWREDFALVRDLGLNYLRYGLPYHSTHLGPDLYDWSFADEALAELKRLGITPILDLLHFGLPDWLGDFQNPEFPAHFARYAGAVAERYPWIRFYTPVNEIYVCARFSALQGVWNEQLSTDRGFLTCIKHLCGASILAAEAIARHRPDLVVVQSESAEITTDMRAEPDARIALENELRFLSLDLLYAKSPSARVLLWMFDNGMTPEEFDWFMAGKPAGYQVMGIDYYGRNERMILPDGSEMRAEDLNGWYGVTKGYYQRYQRPAMHTETNVFDPEFAPKWLWKQFANVLRMRSDNIPVLGFTWYSLTDQLDWDIGLCRKAGHVNACGLYDLDCRIRKVGEAYRTMIAEFGRIALVPHADLLALTAEAAELKTER